MADQTFSVYGVNPPDPNLSWPSIYIDSRDGYDRKAQPDAWAGSFVLQVEDLLKKLFDTSGVSPPPIPLAYASRPRYI